jgi:hypothetical protein
MNRSIIFVTMLIVSTYFCSAQIPEIEIYPVLQVRPQFPLVSVNDGMGLLELAILDPIRDGFINPTKLSLLHGNVLYLGATRSQLFTV